MNFLYWLWHSIVGCSEKDIVHKRGVDICSKCGRMTFIFRR
jgi:hypothetical protein